MQFSPEGEVSIPPCLAIQADRMGVPRPLLTELGRQVGLRRLAQLLSDREALEAALATARAHWRERLVREEGLEG